MQRRSAVPVVVLLLLGFFAAWCFSSIIGRRFTAGEAYPHYSTLRSDALGTMALFESIDRLEGMTSIRNYRSLDKLEGGPGQTLLLLHLTPEVLASKKINGKDVQAFAARGGRVVITLDGQVSNWEEMEKRVDKRREENAEREARKEEEEWRKRREEKAREEKKGKADEKSDDRAGEGKPGDVDEQVAFLRKSRSLIEVLGFTVQPRNFVMTAKGGLKLEKSPALPVDEADLPVWYSRTAVQFEERPAVGKADKPDAGAAGKGAGVSTADRWTALAQVNESVMIAEQKIGQGRVIVATDSFFASNEALLKERSPEFLAWLVGPVREVIFDETHLGTVESPGIMTLARRLHLQGLFIGGLVLFGLFIWQSSSSLVPGRETADHERDSTVAGHGATAGLVSLLRRGIPRSQLLDKCFEVWERSARQTGAAASRVTAAEQVMAPVKGVRVASRQVPVIYQQLCNAIHASVRRHPGKP